MHKSVAQFRHVRFLPYVGPNCRFHSILLLPSPPSSSIPRSSICFSTRLVAPSHLLPAEKVMPGRHTHASPTFLIFLYGYLAVPSDWDWTVCFTPFIMVHIGSIIKQRFEQRGCTISWLARQLNCDRSNIYDIFTRESIDTQRLRELCLALDYDFFKVLSDNLKEKKCLIS